MKKVVFLAVFVLVAAAAWAQPSSILVKYDVTGSYGSAVITAIQAKWSGASITSFNGNTWASFDSALTGGNWDIVIVEAHNYRTSTSSHFANLITWYNANHKLFYADWYAYGSYNNTLETAMGAGNAARVAMPPVPHYAWNASHPICTGVSSWTYVNPGSYGTGGSAYPWTTATAVTGWTSSSTAGQGGIMVAGNGVGIISGYFPSLNSSSSEAATLWGNILDFMWTGGVGVAPASVGKVKALYK